MLDAQDEFVVIEVGQIEFIVDRGDSWQPFHVLDLSIARNLRHLLSKLVKLIVIVVSTPSFQFSPSIGLLQVFP